MSGDEMAMTPALLGTKVGMTRVYDEKGAVVPVTVVQAGPCHVTQVKTVESDGYNAVQLGFLDIKPQAEPDAADRACRQGGRRAQAAFPGDPAEGSDVAGAGAQVGVDLFNEVQFVDVIGTSKGKGFAGVMKRHHFGGQCAFARHGTQAPFAGLDRVARDVARPVRQAQEGRPHGAVTWAWISVTTRNHPLVKIDKENNLLLIKGALPGPNGGLLFVRKSITAPGKAVVAAEVRARPQGNARRRKRNDRSSHI